MNLPGGTERSSILIRALCVRKLQTSGEVKGSKTALSVRVTSPPKPTLGFGEERVESPQARMKKMPPSSTGVRLLDPLRWVFRGRLWQAGEKISIAVGAALAVLESVVERGEELEPPMDSRVVVPYLGDALQYFVVQKYAKLCPG